MTPFPLNLIELLGQYGAYAVFLLIGFGFGYVLEISGFGSSPKLAGQFYFKEMTVLKVMFTAIIVAMLGIFLASGLGLLDYNLIWVNPTYLWPGILGGFIMGIGFIVGGFCPGTSLVAMATGKLDGVFFVLGATFGIFAFGESVSLFEPFFNSSYMGRFTLPEFLNMSTGAVVLLVVLMALFMFWGGEQLEKKFGGLDPKRAPRLRYVGAGGVLLVAVAVVFIGQPSTADKWTMLAPEKEPLLVEERAYQIHPGELLDLMHNKDIKLFMLDLRTEANYNIFHIRDAQHAPFSTLADLVGDLMLEPSNAVFVVMSNHEELAVEGWKILVAEGLHNVYILEGGINYWLDTFDTPTDEQLGLFSHAGVDDLHYDFEAALGDRHEAADPDPEHFELEFVPKVKLELKKGPSGGGCG
ncbi:MAG: YeeE/YedE thiosulfate transporter family protein [Anaerolineae bacterium]|nr:YeeE/YedE thiosulfate transporter family protein [Anaerolineae bacterium]